MISSFGCMGELSEIGLQTHMLPHMEHFVLAGTRFDAGPRFNGTVFQQHHPFLGVSLPEWIGPQKSNQAALLPLEWSKPNKLQSPGTEEGCGVYPILHKPKPDPPREKKRRRAPRLSARAQVAGPLGVGASGRHLRGAHGVEHHRPGLGGRMSESPRSPRSSSPKRQQRDPLGVMALKNCRHVAGRRLMNCMGKGRSVLTAENNLNCMTSAQVAERTYLPNNMLCSGCSNVLKMLLAIRNVLLRKPDS